MVVDDVVDAGVCGREVGELGVIKVLVLGSRKMASSKAATPMEMKKEQWGLGNPGIRQL